MHYVFLATPGPFSGTWPGVAQLVGSFDHNLEVGISRYM